MKFGLRPKDALSPVLILRSNLVLMPSSPFGTPSSALWEPMEHGTVSLSTAKLVEKEPLDTEESLRASAQEIKNLKLVESNFPQSPSTGVLWFGVWVGTLATLANVTPMVSVFRMLNALNLQFANRESVKIQLWLTDVHLCSAQLDPHARMGLVLRMSMLICVLWCSALLGPSAKTASVFLSRNNAARTPIALLQMSVTMENVSIYAWQQNALLDLCANMAHVFPMFANLIKIVHNSKHVPMEYAKNPYVENVLQELFAEETLVCLTSISVPIKKRFQPKCATKGLLFSSVLS